MRWRMPDFSLAMTILWIWIGFVVVLVAGWWVLRWWKKRHPPPPPPAPAPSYSQQLNQRLSDSRQGKRVRQGRQGHAPHDR